MTTNPGAPDSPGQGERPTMNSAGMQFNALLGYVFTTGSDMISWLGDDEQANALYRFYNGSDHMYTIDPEFLQEFPQTYKKLNAYRIPRGEITANLLVTTDTEKGSAGYDNALGYYLANENGPQVGYVVVPSAEGNYCLFSDHRWNPNDKDQTKWHGRNRQMWEDLMNGDDDYDDLF